MKEKGNVEFTFKGFNSIFEANLSKYITQLLAYEATEKFSEIAFGHRKYSDFESFRANRYRKIKDNGY